MNKVKVGSNIYPLVSAAVLVGFSIAATLAWLNVLPHTPATHRVVLTYTGNLTGFNVRLGDSNNMISFPGGILTIENDNLRLEIEGRLQH